MDFATIHTMSTPVDCGGGDGYLPAPAKCRVAYLAGKWEPLVCPFAICCRVGPKTKTSYSSTMGIFILCQDSLHCLTPGAVNNMCESPCSKQKEHHEGLNDEWGLLKMQSRKLVRVSPVRLLVGVPLWTPTHTHTHTRPRAQRTQSSAVQRSAAKHRTEQHSTHVR